METDGSVICLGYGANGELGNGELQAQSTPVFVVDSSGDRLTGFTQISAGYSHTCGLKSDGAVMCWGNGGSGRLGNGETDTESTPVYVVDSSGSRLISFTQISALYQHTCGVKSDGTVMCWGRGVYGQLGNGETGSQSTPVSVVDSSGTEVTGITEIAAGRDHTCALKSNGSVLCWGYGYFGQLGNGARETIPYAATVVDSSSNTLTGFAQITTGHYHTCGMKSNGTTMCWGSDDFVGNGESDSDALTPVSVIDSLGNTLTGFTEISAGHYHTCGVKSDGTTMCWGSGEDGRLGNGESDNAATPVFVVDSSGEELSEFAQIDAAFDHTCGVTDDGIVLCWGDSLYGKLGNLDWTDDQDNPVTVEGF